jgi:hypothetical protein
MTGDPLGGRCLVINDASQVTRESLMAQGLSEKAADEIMEFAHRLTHGVWSAEERRYVLPPSQLPLPDAPC